MNQNMNIPTETRENRRCFIFASSRNLSLKSYPYQICWTKQSRAAHPSPGSTRICLHWFVFVPIVVSSTLLLALLFPLAIKSPFLCLSRHLAHRHVSHSGWWALRSIVCRVVWPYQNLDDSIPMRRRIRSFWHRQTIRDTLCCFRTWTASDGMADRWVHYERSPPRE